MNQLIIAVIIGALSLLPSKVLSVESDKVYKVGISSWTGYPKSVQGFKESMTKAGLIEGENIQYLYGESGTDKALLTTIANAFKEAKVDLVYSLTTPGTIIIKEIMPETTPIVFSIVTYPADSGLIESFEYSANNLVGTSNFVPLRNYVTLLKTILPETKRLAIFHRKGEPNSKIQATNMVRLLRRAAIETIDQEPESLEEIREMALALVDKVDVFMTTTDTLMQGGGEKALIEISLAKKIPIMSSNKKGIEAGSTFGPVADFYSLGKMSGQMAANILTQQLDPSSLSSKVQDPPLILINRSSIKLLGLSVPEKLNNVSYVK